MRQWAGWRDPAGGQETGRIIVIETHLNKKKNNLNTLVKFTDTMTTIRPFTCDDLFKFNGINLGRKLLRVAGVSITQIGFIGNPELAGSRICLSSYNYITLAVRTQNRGKISFFLTMESLIILFVLTCTCCVVRRGPAGPFAGHRWVVVLAVICSVCI